MTSMMERIGSVSPPPGLMRLALGVLATVAVSLPSAGAAQTCSRVNELLREGWSVPEVANAAGVRRAHVRACIRQGGKALVSPAGPPPQGAAGPPPLGAAGPPPLGAAGPAPSRAGGPAPFGTAGR